MQESEDQLSDLASKKSQSAPPSKGDAGALGPATIRQVSHVMLAFAVYLAVRALTSGSEADAFTNARKLLHFESVLGIAWEHTIQAAALSRPAVLGVFNWIYAWTYWPILFGTLIVTWFANRELFFRFRNSLLVSGGIGLMIFTLVPVAPPRFLHEYVDTVSSSHRSNFIAYPSFVINKFAALPSFHVGWTALACLVLSVMVTQMRYRLLLAIPPVLMSVAVVVTANHYIVDIVAGLALTLGSFHYVTKRRTRRSTIALGEPDNPIHLGDRDQSHQPYQDRPCDHLTGVG